MMKDSFRIVQFLLFCMSLVVLSASFYFQYIKGLQPCPLCVMQRVCVILALALTLPNVFFRKTRGWRGIIVLQILVAAAGVYFSGRQLWLQSLPAADLPACLPGLDVLLRFFPWQDIFHALIWGAADCAEISWQWLGISMPGWSLGYFLLLLLGTVGTGFLAIMQNPILKKH